MKKSKLQPETKPEMVVPEEILQKRKEREEALKENEQQDYN